jgi:hypothetical protein
MGGRGRWSQAVFQRTRTSAPATGHLSSLELSRIVFASGVNWALNSGWADSLAALIGWHWAAAYLKKLHAPLTIPS